MKRLLTILLALLFATSAMADWSVTATWTPSPGPDLATEELLLDGVAQTCPTPGTCTFTITEPTGQAVVIRSTNNIGGFSDYALGTLSPVPAPASGGSLVMVWVP